jgi:hypothetical protein
LEKSHLAIENHAGGGVSVTLFPLCDAGGENPNVILIRNVAFKSLY